MSTTTITIELDEALKASLEGSGDEGASLADLAERALQEWARGTMRAAPAWTPEEVASFLAGAAELDAGAGIPHEMVAAEIRARFGS